jgi:hypothetical protein
MQLFDNRFTTLSSSITTSASSATSSNTVLGSPTGVVELVFDYNDSTKYEKVYATISGSTITLLARGVDNGGVGKTHDTGALIAYAFTKEGHDHLLSGVNSGWVAFEPQVINHTALLAFTFVSTTSWKVSGDWTNVISIGDKVRLVNNGSTKYGFVTTKSFASGETTFGWDDGLGGSTTLLAPGTITVPHYSKGMSPEGMPASALFNTGRLQEWVHVGQNFGVTYSRVSNTVMRLNGADLTSSLAIGDKVRYVNNGTTKYAVLSAVATSSGNTEITLQSGTVFTLDSGTITTLFVARVPDPVGFPTSFACTVSETGFSVTPSGGYAAFSTNGRTAYLHYYRSTSGTSNSTGKNLTLPFASISSVGGATQYINVVDNGASALGKWSLPAGSATVSCFPSATAPNWTASGNCNLASDFLLFSWRF